MVFHWEQILEIPEEAHSLKLLREVIDLWFTIRGFSVIAIDFLKNIASYIKEHLK